MFDRTTETTDTRTQAALPVTSEGVVERRSPARGGVSGTAIFTGVVVAFGAMFLLSALVAGVLTALDATGTADLQGVGTLEIGIGAIVAFAVAQFLAYLWGGYTAGRMARGAGAANGLLVPLIALVVAVAVGAVTGWMGANASLNLPFSEYRLPLEEDVVVEWGLYGGIAALVAMFLGGLLGGIAGARWHTRLERRVLAETVEETNAAIDLTEDHRVDRADSISRHPSSTVPPGYTDPPGHTTPTGYPQQTPAPRR